MPPSPLQASRSSASKRTPSGEPMHTLLLLLLTLTAVALIGALARRQRAERTYRRPLRPAPRGADVAPWTEPPPQTAAPLVLFSERVAGDPVSVLPNTQISWPALIVRGSVGVFVDDSGRGGGITVKGSTVPFDVEPGERGNKTASGSNDGEEAQESDPQITRSHTEARPANWTRLSVLEQGSTFPGPFELLGIDTGVKYVTLEGTLLQPIAAPSIELVLAALEKTLIYPFLELFEDHGALAVLEAVTTDVPLPENPVTNTLQAASTTYCRQIVLKEGQRMVLGGELLWIESGTVRLVPVSSSGESLERTKRSEAVKHKNSSGKTVPGAEKSIGVGEEVRDGKHRNIFSSNPHLTESGTQATGGNDRTLTEAPSLPLEHCDHLLNSLGHSCSESPIHGPGSLLGVLGALFSSCRGVFAVEAVSDKVTAYLRSTSSNGSSQSRFSYRQHEGSASHLSLSAASTPSSPVLQPNNVSHTNSSTPLPALFLNSRHSITLPLQQLFCASLKKLFRRSIIHSRTDAKKHLPPSDNTASLKEEDVPRSTSRSPTLSLFVCWAACVTWKRLYPRSALFTAGSRCTSLHLINNQVLCAPGALLRNTTHTHSYVVNRLCDAVSVPSSVLEHTLSRGTALAASLARRLLLHSCHRSSAFSSTATRLSNASLCPGNGPGCSLLSHSCAPLKHQKGLSSVAASTPPVSGSVVLVVGAASACTIFLSRLARTLLDKCTVVRGRELFAASGGRSDGLSELFVTEYLDGLRRRHRIVLVHLENDWSRMLRLVAAACDTLYVVGTAIVVPECCSVRPDAEFILLHGMPGGNVRFSRGVAWRRPGNAGSAARTSRNNEASGSRSVARGCVSSSAGRSGSSDTESSCEDNNKPACDTKAEAVPPGKQRNTVPYRRIHHVFCPEEDGHCMKDFERIARCLSGERIGLVLGGGGARGLAHIGVIQALEEENIPIDCIGGTSMGAFVGAIYARHLSFTELYSRSRAFARRCSSIFYTLLDITFPYVSLFTGRSFDAALKTIFGCNTLIQDLWLEYYCITTDLLDAAECVITTGPVWQWVRASMSICGYLPPVVAPSTTKSEADNKQTFYVDGAYVNNVPCDVMQRTHGISTIIAVDVADQGDTPVDPYDSKSGIVLLFKWFFRAKRYIGWREMQYRLAFLSTSEKKRALDDQRVLMIEPELATYRTNDFARFDEIVAAGYAAARDAIRRWRMEGRLPGPGRRRARRFSI